MRLLAWNKSSLRKVPFRGFRDEKLRREKLKNKENSDFVKVKFYTNEQEKK
jgi:hypothetical protein